MVLYLVDRIRIRKIVLRIEFVFESAIDEAYNSTSFSAEENPTAGFRELRTKHPRKRRVIKNNSESAPKRVHRHEFVNYVFLPYRLLLVPSGNLSKLDAEISLSVSGASRFHFLLRTTAPGSGNWRQTWSEKDVLFRARATGKLCATRLPARDSSVQLYYKS